MELCDPGYIRRVCEKNGFRFSKAMGQNFLIDPSVPEDIAELSGANEKSAVLEIGPGIGTLTRSLAARAGRVCAVELDRRLIPVLGDTLSDFDNTEVINADILKTDLAALVGERFAALEPMVCANLPYNITTPVLTKLIESGLFHRITVMIQREVALRVCARPGTADYGAFSIFAQYHTEPEIVLNVPPESFMPSPKVSSAVIRLERRSAPPAVLKDERLFFRTVRAAFAQRRKTLLNALSAGFSGVIAKQELAAAVAAAGIDPGVRGETLGIAEYAALSNALGAYIRKGEQ